MTEPRMGNILGVSFGKKKGHEELVSQALDTFTKAEQQMNDAVRQIEEGISQEAALIREAQERMEAASGSRDKLNRVLARLKALTE